MDFQHHEVSTSLTFGTKARANIDELYDGSSIGKNEQTRITRKTFPYRVSERVLIICQHAANSIDLLIYICS